MQATVTKKVDSYGVFARVRRSFKEERVWASLYDLAYLRVGDKIEVKRVPNNPYLVLVSILERNL